MPNRPVEDEPDSSSRSDLKAPHLAVQWERDAPSVLDNLRDFLFAPHVRILRPGALPLHAQCIWSRDTLLPRAQGLSLGAHLLIVGLLLLPLTLDKLPPHGGPPRPPFIFVNLAELREILVVKKPQPGGGGGGGRDVEPATRGRLALPADRQIAPPSLPKNENAVLLVPPTLIGSPDTLLPNIVAPNWGLPDRDRFSNSDGRGKRGGQGDGEEGGQGDRRGPGYGDDETGVGIGLPRSGRSVTEVVCSFCPNPAYTEEARKVKFNGRVMLRVVVSAEGAPLDVRVVQPVGFGLDESAVRAVRQWKFRPARDTAGRPVAAWTFVEVNFHIY